MYADADYSEGTTAHLWLCNKVKERAEAIRDGIRRTFEDGVAPVPTHLIHPEDEV